MSIDKIHAITRGFGLGHFYFLILSEVLLLGVLLGGAYTGQIGQSFWS